MDRKRSREDADASERPTKYARGDSTHLVQGKFFVLRHKREDDVYCIFSSFDQCRPYLERKDIAIVGFDTYQEAEHFATFPVPDSNAADGTSSCKATHTPYDVARVDVTRDKQVSNASSRDPLSHLPDAIFVKPAQQVTVYANGTTCTTSKNAKMSFGVYFREESPYNCAGSVTGSVSSQRADLKAALEAIKIIFRFSMVIPGGVIELCVNSSYVRSGLESWMRRWKEHGWKNANKRTIKNADLWKEVDSLLTDFGKANVHLNVRSAIGSPGSFNAGRLAAKVMYLEK